MSDHGGKVRARPLNLDRKRLLPNGATVYLSRAPAMDLIIGPWRSTPARSSAGETLIVARLAKERADQISRRASTSPGATQASIKVPGRLYIANGRAGVQLRRTGNAPISPTSVISNILDVFDCLRLMRMLRRSYALATSR